MIAEQYGLRYKRVTPDDIELIRYWRNQPFIRDTMQFTEYITPEMQLAWFNRINTKDNYYFIIEADNKQIGMINCKEAHPVTRVAEGGIFIWDLDYWNTPIPVFAALSLLEGVFELFNAAGSSLATVKKDNFKAIQFNKMLGYEIMPQTEASDFIKLMLTKERYLEKTVKLKRAAGIYSKNKSKLIIVDMGPPELLSEEILAYLRSST